MNGPLVPAQPVVREPAAPVKQRSSTPQASARNSTPDSVLGKRKAEGEESSNVRVKKEPV